MRKYTVDRNNSTSLPQQISNILRERIEMGIYKPNSRLDSLTSLIAEFNVSQVTVMRALDILEKEGLINRIRAKGVYVSEKISKPRMLVLTSLNIDSANQTPFIISGIEERFRKNNIKAEFCSLEAVWERSPEEYDSLFSQFQGVIDLGGGWEGSEKLFIALENLRIPVIHPIAEVRNISHFTNGAVLAIDERIICRNALEFLKEMGHKRVAFCAYMPENGYFRGYSVAQFVELLTELGFDTDPELFLFFPLSEISALENVKNILAMTNQPSALMCYSDYWAFGMMEALHRLEVEIPNKLSIMGISGFPGGEFTSPPLTTISYEYFNAGYRAAELLLTKDEWFVPKQLFVETIKHKLVVRSSVKQIKEKE